MATGPSNALLTVGIEVIGVGLLTLLAGTNDHMGTAVVIFMVGLWLIFAITQPQVFSGISNAVTNVSNQAG